jgi:hypothetical protein
LRHISAFISVFLGSRKGDPMQRIIWTFIILSPLIALVQSYQWPILSLRADLGLASMAVALVSTHVSPYLQAAHSLLG